MNTKYVLGKLSALVIVMVFAYCAIVPAMTLFNGGKVAEGCAAILMDLAGSPALVYGIKKLFGIK